jgi:N-acyl homoserine lactone hydrolase
MTDADRLERRLAEIGFAVRDLTHVVNTHLHFDHAGQNHLFPSVPIVVQREAYTAAMDGRDPAREYYDRPELSYELVEGDVDLLEGVTLLLSPGHVPGLQSVLLRGAGLSPVLLAGDAISLRESLDTDNWAAFADPERARASAARLCRVAEREDATLLFGHDTGQWPTLRHPPDFYGEPRGEVT